MTKPLRLDDEAGEEIEAAADWYHLRRPELAGEFLAAVREALERIPEAPSSWALVPGLAPDLGIRRCLLRRFPFSIVYIELETEIRVLAVAHGHREPGYWRRR